MQRLRTRLRAGASTFPSATFALNFLTGGLDPAVTFTRSSTATFTGSNGLIQTAAINAPRFDYDPVTLAAKGLLIEEQRTNLFTYSEDLRDTAAAGATRPWIYDSASVSVNTIASPDGSTNADTVIEAANNSVHRIYEQINVTSGVAVTMSFYAKAKERTQVVGTGGTAAYGTQVRVLYDLSAVTATIQSGAVTATITDVGNGWRKCTWTATPSVTTTGNHFIGLALSGNDTYLGNGTSGAYVWGAQLEAGSFATSYIPTVASQVTRSADVATMTGTNFSSWYNQSAGTFVIQASTYVSGAVNGNQYLLSASDNTVTNRITMFRAILGTNFSSRVTVGGVAANPGNVDIFTTNTIVKCATAASAGSNNVISAGAGTLSSAATTASMPVVTQLSIGTNETLSSSFLNGHIRQIAYYNTRLPNATLQALTA